MNQKEQELADDLAVEADIKKCLDASEKLSGHHFMAEYVVSQNLRLTLKEANEILNALA